MAKYTRFTQAITLGLLMQCIHLLDASENLQQDPRSIVQRLGVACRLRGGSSRWSRRSRKLGLHEDSENLFGDGEEEKSSFWSSSEEGGPGAHAQRREHGRGYMDWSSLTSTEDVADLPYVKHKGHHGFVMSVAVHQGRVFTGGMDKSVRVWDSATGETVAELETKEREEANLLPGAVTALAIAGGYVWGGTNNGVLHVWDLDSLELVAQLGADEDGVPEEQRHAGGIEALAVLDSVAGRAWAGGAQGPAVLTGCGDGAVRLWAADATHRCLAALQGHAEGAVALCLSVEHPDQLLTGSSAVRRLARAALPARPAPAAHAASARLRNARRGAARQGAGRDDPGVGPRLAPVPAGDRDGRGLAGPRDRPHRLQRLHSPRCAVRGEGRGVSD